MKKKTVTEPTGHPCDVVDDPLTEVLRFGAQRLLVHAIEAQAEAFLALMADRKLEDGRARFVRHGHGPERRIQTGIGSVPVQRAKIRDRGRGEADKRIRFTSAILPRWACRSPSLEALLPVLYLCGVSTGDFQEALSALLGPRLCDPCKPDQQRCSLALLRSVLGFRQCSLDPDPSCVPPLPSIP